MHSIGNYILKNTDKKVLYISSDKFVNDFINAVRYPIVGNLSLFLLLQAGQVNTRFQRLSSFTNDHGIKWSTSISFGFKGFSQ